MRVDLGVINVPVYWEYNFYGVAGGDGGFPSGLSALGLIPSTAKWKTSMPTTQTVHGPT